MIRADVPAATGPLTWGGNSATSCVPASVPSVVQSDEPFSAYTMKRARLLTRTGAPVLPISSGVSWKVPASVPSVRHRVVLQSSTKSVSSPKGVRLRGSVVVASDDVVAVVPRLSQRRTPWSSPAVKRTPCGVGTSSSGSELAPLPRKTTSSVPAGVPSLVQSPGRDAVLSP